jgi:hypothetical protein
MGGCRVDSVIGDRDGFDVFVSYRHDPADRAWVHGRLVPALRSVGLSVCVDREAFEPGAVVLSEIERAVRCCELTVAVVSRAYVESRFCELEDVLSRALDNGSSSPRVVVAMREECELPEALSTAPVVDASEQVDVNVVATWIADRVRAVAE